MKKKRVYDICKKIPKGRVKLKKINGCWRCSKCNQQKRKEHREFLKRNICGIRTKEQQIKDWKKAREEKKIIIPKIKPIKKRAHSKQLHMYLTRDEKLILYKKFISHGFSEDVAKRRIANIVCVLEKLKIKLKEEFLENTITKEEMQKKFIEGLEKHSRII